MSAITNQQLVSVLGIPEFEYIRMLSYGRLVNIVGVYTGTTEVTLSVLAAVATVANLARQLSLPAAEQYLLLPDIQALYSCPDATGSTLPHMFVDVYDRRFVELRCGKHDVMIDLSTGRHIHAQNIDFVTKLTVNITALVWRVRELVKNKYPTGAKNEPSLIDGSAQENYDG